MRQRMVLARPGRFKHVFICCWPLAGALRGGAWVAEAEQFRAAPYHKGVGGLCTLFVAELLPSALIYGGSTMAHIYH